VWGALGFGLRVRVQLRHRERGLISLARDGARPERQPKEDVEQQLVAQLGMVLQGHLEHADLVRSKCSACCKCSGRSERSERSACRERGERRERSERSEGSECSTPMRVARRP